MLLTIVVLTIIGFFWVLMTFSFTLRNFCGARVSSLGSGNGVLNDEGWFKGFCGRSRSGGGKEKPGYKLTVRAAAMLVLPMLCERTIFSL